jgi:tetratricopeptide (TPR) repeat protein
MVVRGTGWGALESLRRAKGGEPPLAGAGAPFDADSLTDDQRPWLELLNGAGFAGARSYIAGEHWRALLEALPPSAPGLLHLAVLAHAEGRVADADRLYRRSIELGPTTVAHRGFALLARSAGDAATAVASYEVACRLDRRDRAVLVEAATALLELGRPDRAATLVRAADATVRGNGRVRLLLARSLADSGDGDAAVAILRSGLEVEDLREGENSVQSLWERLRPGEPVPERYRFDMQQQAGVPVPAGRGPASIGSEEQG